MNSFYYKITCSQFPQISLAGHVRITPPYVHTCRRPDEYILYFILDGEMFLEEKNDTETNSYHLVPGDFLILDPAFEHYGSKASDCTYYYIHFSCNDFSCTQEHLPDLKETLKALRFSSFSCESSHANELLYLPKYYHMPQSAMIHLKNCLSATETAFLESLEGHRLKTSCLFLDFLIEASRSFTGDILSGSCLAASGSSATIHRILNYFQDHYMEDISGDSISDIFQCNFDYINRKFKQTTGKTIFYYLNELRIMMAKQYLQSGYYTISEVADKTGFHDVYYFSKVFKKYTGISPGKYIV